MSNLIKYPIMIFALVETSFATAIFVNKGGFLYPILTKYAVLCEWWAAVTVGSIGILLSLLHSHDKTFRQYHILSTFQTFNCIIWGSLGVLSFTTGSELWLSITVFLFSILNLSFALVDEYTAKGGSYAKG